MRLRFDGFAVNLSGFAYVDGIVAVFGFDRAFRRFRFGLLGHIDGRIQGSCRFLEIDFDGERLVHALRHTLGGAGRTGDAVHVFADHGFFIQSRKAL